MCMYLFNEEGFSNKNMSNSPSVLLRRLHARVDGVAAHDVDAGHGEASDLGVVEEVEEGRASDNAAEERQKGERMVSNVQ